MSTTIRRVLAVLATLIACAALLTAAPTATADVPNPDGGGSTPCMADPQLKKENGYVMARMHFWCTKPIKAAKVISAQVVLQEVAGDRRVAYSNADDSTCGKLMGTAVRECFGSWARIKDTSGNDKYYATYEPSGTYYLVEAGGLGGDPGSGSDGTRIDCSPKYIKDETISCPTARKTF